MAGRRLGRGLQFLLSDRSDGTDTKKSDDKSSAAEPSKAKSRDGGDGAKGRRAAPDSKSDAPVEGEGRASTGTDEPDLGTAREVEIARLTPNPHQPRKVFREDELQALSESIRKSGILQPILVRARGERFEIVAGERRYRAAKRVGLDHVPVLIREVDDVELRLFALVENLQRSDLDPIEKARSFRDIQSATGWTHGKIAEAVGFDRSHVTNFLRLLELEAPIQKSLREGKLSMGHARALLAAKPEIRVDLAERILNENLSVRAVERLAKESAQVGEESAKPAARPRAAWARQMEEHLIEALGCRVTVKPSGKSGRIVIEPGPRAELDRVYELLLNAIPDSDEDTLVARKKKATTKKRKKSG